LNREGQLIPLHSPPFDRSTGVNRTTLESWPTSSVTCGCTIWVRRRCHHYLSNSAANPGVSCNGGPQTDSPALPTVPSQLQEEFTFNNDGEVTFVEAWSHSLPKSARMSARIPGLGQPSGAIDPNDGVVWDPIAAVQPDVATLHARAQNLVTQGASIALTYSSLNGMEGSGVEVKCHRKIINPIQPNLTIILTRNTRTLTLRTVGDDRRLCSGQRRRAATDDHCF